MRQSGHYWHIDETTSRSSSMEGNVLGDRHDPTLYPRHDFPAALPFDYRPDALPFFGRRMEEKESWSENPRSTFASRLSLGLIAVAIVVSGFIFGSAFVDGPKSLSLIKDKFGATFGTKAKTLDVVFAYYKEDHRHLSDLATYFRAIGDEKALKTRILVYSKNADHQNATIRADFERTTGVDEVVSIPNIGREGETYLRHITENYDGNKRALADWTIFSQTGMVGFSNAQKQDPWFDTALKQYFQANVSFLSLASPGNHHVSFCGLSSSGQFWPRLSEVSNLVYGTDLCRERRMISWNGQFIVSRQRIHAQPLRTYQSLYNPFHEPAEAAIHLYHGAPTCADMLRANGNKVDVSNPCWGHYMERSWNMLFQCSQEEIAADCIAGKFCGCTN